MHPSWPSVVGGPDRDEARRWLADELSGQEYHRQEPIIRRVLEWLFSRIDTLLIDGQIIPGLSNLALIVVLVVVAAAVVFAVRGTRRGARLRAAPAGSVLDEEGLSAADYRRRAEAALRDGDWDTVLLDSYRALTAASHERTLLDDLPGQTADEVAEALTRPFPDRTADLRAAAAAFDEVRYGGMSTPEARARAVHDLDRSLSRARPRMVATT